MGFNSGFKGLNTGSQDQIYTTKGVRLWQPFKYLFRVQSILTVPLQQLWDLPC